jgi:predicted transcriptional regulator
MPPRELDQLMDELKNWCEKKHGRRMELARHLEVSPQLVTNWLAGRRQLTVPHFFAIKEFLKHHKK